MSRSLTDCNNCLQRFKSHYPFCPYCGQKANDQLTLGVLFNNTLSNYFSVDARFFKSFIPLLLKPGYLAKQFVKGRRLLYLHPAQMYLFISIVFFFLFSFISRDQAEFIDTQIKKDIERSERYKDSVGSSMNLKTNVLLGNPDSIEVKELVANTENDILKPKEKNNGFLDFNLTEMEIDSMIAAGASDQQIYKAMGMTSEDGFFKKRVYKQAIKFMRSKSGGSIFNAFTDSIPLAMFILLPIFALILKVFYYKKGRFAHHLVFSFYFFAFIFAMLTLIVIGNLIWNEFPGWLVTLMVLSIFLYLYVGLKRFYEQGWALSLIKTNVISFLFLLFVLPFAIIIMGVMAFLFY